MNFNIYCFSYFLGRLFSAFLFLALSFMFVKNKSIKNLLIASIVSLFLIILFSVMGGLNGRLISWPLFLHLFVKQLWITFIAVAVCDAFILGFKFYNQKWFSKILCWIGLAFNIMILLPSLPAVFMEQWHLSRLPAEMTMQMYEWTEKTPQQKQQVIYSLIKKDSIHLRLCLDQLALYPEAKFLPVANGVELCLNR